MPTFWIVGLSFIITSLSFYTGRRCRFTGGASNPFSEFLRLFTLFDPLQFSSRSRFNAAGFSSSLWCPAWEGIPLFDFLRIKLRKSKRKMSRLFLDSNIISSSSTLPLVGFFRIVEKYPARASECPFILQATTLVSCRRAISGGTISLIRYYRPSRLASITESSWKFRIRSKMIFSRRTLIRKLY